ncbi:VanZ family protein [Cupriavidus pauculus]|uniref:VanZ family protein n=1 Tax=Cupriavidus pauculus TaxID=82633 RepID=A0A3G8H542_9BURK|nr:VanZ family protein [Cupriavidus pauculus]
MLVLSLLPPDIPEPTTGWDKTNHMLAFGVLAALGVRSWPGRVWPVIVWLVAYGGLIEILQSLTSYRDASWPDLLADSLGIAIGLMLSYRAIRA